MHKGLFELRYMYRDGGNYKFRAHIFINGLLRLSDLTDFLICGEYFIPKAIGLPDLRPAVLNEDDHLLHEFEEIVPIAEGISQIAAKDLYARIEFAHKSGWFFVIC